MHFVGVFWRVDRGPWIPRTMILGVSNSIFFSRLFGIYLVSGCATISLRISRYGYLLETTRTFYLAIPRKPRARRGLRKRYDFTGGRG